MSGVIGASLRSMAGSPACTATVSECGIGSAYLKPFEPGHLFRVDKVFQHLETGFHLYVVPGDQRQLATDAGRIGPRTRAIEKADRPIQPARFALRPAQGSLGLGLQQRILVPAAKLQDGEQSRGCWHSVVYAEHAQSS